MRKKLEWRIQRPLTFVVVAVVLLAAATAGALAPRFVRHADHPTKAASSAGGSVLIAGEAAPAAAAPKAAPDVVTPRRQNVKPARGHAPTGAAGARSNATRGLAAAVSADLCAVAGNATMSDSTSIPIWGFAPMPPSNDCADATAQLPGPQIDAAAGDTVTLNITNAIDGHTISFEAAGVDFSAASDPDAGPGETASVTFNAVEGTYLYDSAGDSGRQQAMGLYGALVVGSGTAGQADGVTIDDDETLVLSEIDPNFNADPDGFDMNAWHPSRWLINGVDAPGTATITASPGQRLLLRYVNAGVDHNTMALLGLHQRIVASDGFVLANPYDAVSVTFPAGETGDALVTAGASGSTYPLYNQNGKPGMTTFIQVQ